MNPRAVVAASRAAYASAEVYRDRGSFQRVDASSGRVEAQGTFATAFARRSHELSFSFTGVDDGLPIAGGYVAKAGRIVERSGWVPVDAATLAAAVASTTGVFPPSHFIPSLLDPGIGGSALWDHEPDAEAREEVVESIDCRVVTLGARWARMEVAVGNADLLIRRIAMPHFWIPNHLRTAALVRLGTGDDNALVADAAALFIVAYTVLS